MLEIWKTAVEQFDIGQDFALATTISEKGACPRHVGARLLVLNDGTMVFRWELNE
jgi:xanthine/CO dehydrogenase XdhC/CoxF family maturation factor